MEFVEFVKSADDELARNRRVRMGKRWRRGSERKNKNAPERSNPGQTP